LATMGGYCKAYPLRMLREFSGWTEKTSNARKIVVEGKDEAAVRDLTDDTFLCLQEDYVVTDGIFKDENIIYDDVTAEWIEFCRTALGFDGTLDGSSNPAESTTA